MSDDARSTEEIRSDIEQTRDELGDTVEALAAKTDVKARAQDKVEEIKGNVRDQKDAATAKVKDVLPGGGGGSSTGASGEGGPGAAEKAQQLGNQAAATAKANPLPLAVAGALLLGFLIGRRRSS